MRVLRHIEVAADDREVDLAVGQRLRALGGAFGLHRPQPDIGVVLGEGLGQRLHDLEVVAVRGADRDPQDHRPHREIIAGRQRADDGENAREHDQVSLPPRRRGERGAHRGRDRRSSIAQQWLEG